MEDGENNMTKGLIYYTDFHIDPLIQSVCLSQLKKSFNGEMVSVSLNKPLDLGKNIVLKNRERSYLTMALQILTALENSTAKYIFFCEHDVLYSKSHFDFIPPKDNVYYYNIFNYRWDYPKNRAISYDKLISLSGLCVNREFAIKHYKKRLELIQKKGWDKDKSKDPKWARRMGYEPGVKSKRQSLFLDNDYEIRESQYPNIDIRHSKTFSPPKITLESFKHKPIDWKEETLDKIEGWDLKKLFNIK